METFAEKLGFNFVIYIFMEPLLFFLLNLCVATETYNMFAPLSEQWATSQHLP